jgi:hypothetical protein
MGEALEKEGAAEVEHEGPNPLHHIQDKVLLAIDQHGHVVFRPEEGTAFRPMMAGPMKLEFTKHMAGLTVGAALLFAVGWLVARGVIAGLSEKRAPRGALANLIEALIVFIRDEVVVPVGGHHLGHYTPIFIKIGRAHV